jgi:hypothetical protein
MIFINQLRLTPAHPASLNLIVRIHVRRHRARSIVTRFATGNRAAFYSTQYY